MDLEQRIKELERQLALKNAYLAVNVTFGNKKIPQDIKKEVETKLKEMCTQLAEGLTVLNDVTTSTFSVKEVEVLKQLANTVLTKAPTQEKSVTPEGSDEDQPLRATLLSTESIPRNLRNDVNSMEEVIITNLSMKENKATIVTRKGKLFTVPKDDLELLQQ